MSGHTPWKDIAHKNAKYEDEWRERLRWRITGRWSERVVEQRIGRPVAGYPQVGVAEYVFGFCLGALIIGPVAFFVLRWLLA